MNLGVSPEKGKEVAMATMTIPAIAVAVGQPVEVLSEGTWWRGVVAQIDPQRNRPILVHYDVHGVGDEEWFDAASVKPR